MDQEDAGNWGDRSAQNMFGYREDGMGIPSTAWKRKQHEADECWWAPGGQGQPADLGVLPVMGKTLKRLR